MLYDIVNPLCLSPLLFLFVLPKTSNGSCILHLCPNYYFHQYHVTHLHTHTHTHTHTGSILATLQVVSCSLDCYSPLVPNMSILSAQAETFRISLDTVPSSLPRTCHHSGSIYLHCRTSLDLTQSSSSTFIERCDRHTLRDRKLKIQAYEME